MRRPWSAAIATVLLLTLGGAAPSAVTLHTGTDANGAFYTMAVPRNWNGALVVFAHGGPDLATYRPEPSAVVLDQGYAWAASSYRRGGYGVRMAAADTENVRRLFVARYGRPARTYLHGESYGGNVAAKAAELYPRSWDGVLLTNGLLAGGSRGYDARVDLRIVYRYYCHDKPLDECTGRDRDDILAVTRIPERALDVHWQYATTLLPDIVDNRLGGRNPFSNRGVRYTGSHDDEALNAGVERFDADPTARRDLSYDSDLTGLVSAPVLTLHAIGDPQVFVENEAAYRATFRGGDLVQTFTTETEHGGLSGAEYVTALAALDAWVRTGRKPSPRSIAESCPSGCFFDPGFRPAAYGTRVRPRPGGTSWPAMTDAQERTWSRIVGVGIGL
ncbi:alpha/beta hydrolase family protein [Cryptosporangium sp. NPDC051539]|uniref:alpha/beta hydrolase family protein n=1 Tax=Cryptosporangium sp. NPDC051539 TaxID=3363962 RepID=UPI0037B7F95A